MTILLLTVRQNPHRSFVCCSLSSKLPGMLIFIKWCLSMPDHTVWFPMRRFSWTFSDNIIRRLCGTVIRNWTRFLQPTAKQRRKAKVRMKYVRQAFLWRGYRDAARKSSTLCSCLRSYCKIPVEWHSRIIRVCEKKIKSSLNRFRKELSKKKAG